MSDFYSATIFLSVFIMIIMDMFVSGNDLMEHDKKQTVYTISVLVIACMVSEWFGVWMNGADPSLRTLHILVKTIELSTAPIITVLCSDLMTPLKHKSSFIPSSASTRGSRCCRLSSASSSRSTHKTFIITKRFTGSTCWPMPAAFCCSLVSC